MKRLVIGSTPQSERGHLHSTVVPVYLISLVWISLFLSMDAGAQKPDSVRVWTEPRVIPTYELGQDDPNPYFATGYREIYPYPFQDDLTDRRVNKTWKA